MKKIIILLLSIFVCTYNISLHAQTELFENPGFEEWSGNAMFGYNPKDWDNTGLGMTFKETGIKLGGETALKMKTNAQPYAKLDQEITQAFVKGDIYELTINYYVVSSQNGDDIVLKSFWTNGGSSSPLAHDEDKLNNNTYFTSVGKWESKTIQTTVPDNATSFYFSIWVSKNSEVVFDDFSLKKIERADPYIEIAPETLNKVYTSVNTPVQMQKITVSSGNLPNPISISVTGTNRTYFTPSVSSIPVTGNTTELTVTYNPTAVGDHSAMLTIECQGAEILTKTVPLRGNAIDPTQKPVITVSPNTPVNLMAEVGKESKQEVFVSGQNMTGYLFASVTGDTQGSIIISNTMFLANPENAKLEITFRPKSAGTFSGTIEFKSENAETVYLQVSGTATQGSAPEKQGDEYPLDTSNPLTLLYEKFDNVTHNNPVGILGWKNIAAQNYRAWWGYDFSRQDGYNEFSAKATAFNSLNTAADPYEMWLITPALDFKNSASKMFTFRVMGDFLIENSDARLELYYLDMDGSELYKQKIDMDMPANPDQNKEWFEYHINLEGQDIADVFFMGFRFAAIGGNQNSAVYYIDDVSYGRTDLPVISASVPQLVMETEINKEITSKQISITAKNLTNPITISVSGANASKFETSVSSLPAAGGTFTVTFSSNQLGVHEAYIKLSSRGAADIYIPVSAKTNSPVPIEVKFSAEEVVRLSYKQGFDSQEEMQGWTTESTNADNTWKLANSKKSGLPNFNTIDADSKFSAAVFYDDNVSQDEKLISPYFTLDKPSICKLYAAFDGSFVLFANFTIQVQKQSDGSLTEIFNAFNWSQESAHERHKWLPFEFDLSDYLNEPVRFIFRYKGIGGDDVYIDNFCIYETDSSEDAKAYVNEGGQVHFKNLSVATGASYEWIFDGGIPATSTEENPVVKYNKAGKYDVTLRVTKDGSSEELTKTEFVNVQGVAPIASFDFPAEGYLSPEAAIYIPRQTDVTFTDKSQNVPTEWLWDLPDSNILTSTEAAPTVRYEQNGVYDVSLTVANAQGTDRIEYRQAIRVGNPCHVWNIGMDESNSLSDINMGFYGYYGGTNWLGMLAFAEEFKKPPVKSEISSVDIYFSRVKSINPPVEIKVSIAKDKDGLPGDELVSATLMSDQLKYDAQQWVPTTFTFAESVEVDEKFYVVVAGIPNRMDEQTYESDEIVMGAVLRDNKAALSSTVYHLLEEWDDQYNPTGEVEWFKNTDENVSFAITPRLSYIDTDTGIKPSEDAQVPEVFIRDGKLMVSGLTGAFDLAVYDMSGKEVVNRKQAYDGIDLSLPAGIYIMQLKQGKDKWAYKIKF